MTNFTRSDQSGETPQDLYHRKHEEHMMNDAGYWDMVPEYGNKNIRLVSNKIIKEWLYHRKTIDRMSSSTLINNKSGMMFLVFM